MDFAQKMQYFEREWGIVFPEAKDFTRREWRKNFDLAMDAQPTLITAPNAGIPGFLLTLMDPDILRILTAKNNATKIYPEEKRGDWTDLTAVFPVVEHTGTVTAYGDFEANGRASANTNFPQRESFLYQIITEYGDLEMARAGKARIEWSAELRMAATEVLQKFQNLTYFFGLAGLQNYGMLNDPALPTPIAPGPKAAGGVVWVSGGVTVATANEIYADILALYDQLVVQSAGNIDDETPLVLALSPSRATALKTTNSFNVNVEDLLKKNFPKLRIETAVQYGAVTAQNPQGSQGGEVMQMIAETVEGQKTGFAAFNEKLRAGRVIPDLSSFKQKMTQGSWGWVGKQPFAVSQMIGI